MLTVLLLVHILLAVSLIGVVLLQRTEGGGLGFGGGGGGNFMTTRGTANLLTRTTAILATCFMGTSLLLVLLGGHGNRSRSIVDDLGAPLSAPVAPASAPAPAAPQAPSQPAQPQGQAPAVPTR